MDIWGIFCPNTDFSCKKGLSEVRMTTQPTVLASGMTGALSVTRSPRCTHLSSLSLQGVTGGGSHPFWAVPSCSPDSHHWGRCCRLRAGRPRHRHPGCCQRWAGLRHRSPSAPCEMEKRFKGLTKTFLIALNAPSHSCPNQGGRPDSTGEQHTWDAGGQRGFRSPNLRV